MVGDPPRSVPFPLDPRGRPLVARTTVELSTFVSSSGLKLSSSVKARRTTRFTTSFGVVTDPGPTRGGPRPNAVEFPFEGEARFRSKGVTGTTGSAGAVVVSEELIV